MRVLVLGGTVFLGNAVAAEAVARGHEVTCAARGESGAVPAGARLVRVDRDAVGGLEPLAGQAFDAVVDVAPVSYPWVADALALVGADAGHWTFVSTINVYADNTTVGQRPGAPLLDPLREGISLAERGNSALYGAIKVAGEDALRDAMGERAFVVRPGLVTGPDDRSDRFGYWPARLARGGRLVVPDAPDQPIQHVDVRDLAAWILDAGERGLAGTFDAIGPTAPLGTFLADIADTVGKETGIEAELVPVAEDTLVAAGVGYWSGPKSMPLWLPATHYGMKSHDPEPARAAGLRVRPLADTVLAALATERALGLDRARKAGLSPAEEADVFAR
jgi:nucleoside-diphosphate-sugar epimerase